MKYKGYEAFQRAAKDFADSVVKENAANPGTGRLYWKAWRIARKYRRKARRKTSQFKFWMWHRRCASMNRLLEAAGVKHIHLGEPACDAIDGSLPSLAESMEEFHNIGKMGSLRPSWWDIRFPRIYAGTVWFLKSAIFPAVVAAIVTLFVTRLLDGIDF